MIDEVVGDTIDAAIARVADLARDADVLVPVGARTHWEVGGPAPMGVEVSAPSGLVEYDPAELTVTVGASTHVRDLDAVLADAGQQCPLDPRDASATVGGVLATGLSGMRRLRYGPVRNRLLEVHVVTGDGRRVKGGGRTVKNVSGYDVARLMVGSFGTLGVIVQVTLRCEPVPLDQAWLRTDGTGTQVLARAYRPSAVLVTAEGTSVLVEGHPEDIAAERARIGADAAASGPPLPDGPHRGRISVRPALVDLVVADVAADGLAAVGEAGVGTVHVAAPTPEGLAAARAVAHRHGGWLLREAGGDDDGFGVDVPNGDLAARIKAALDPSGKCNPGRLPYVSTPAMSAPTSRPAVPS